MKMMLQFSLLAVVALAFAGCQPPATNTNTNTNTNAAPRAAAPTADSLLALDKTAWEAWKNKDGKFFETYLADNFVGFGDDGKRWTKAEAVKGISEHKCDVKSYSLSDPKITPAGNDVYVLTYKATQDATCEGRPSPSTMTVASAFVRAGDSWKGVYHNEVTFVEPPKTEGNTNANAANAPAAAADDKEDAGMEKKETAPASNTTASNTAAANSNSNTAAGSDPLTDAVMAVEKRGWEAWMKQDAKGLQDTTAKDLTFVDPMGKVTQGQDTVIKMWTDGTCKVSSVDVTEGKATEIATNVAILTFKGTAVGTCGTMKLEPLYGTTIAIKEGGAWKAVYIFETPVRKS